MSNFANSLAATIKAAPEFHADFMHLRSAGIFATLPTSADLEHEDAPTQPNEVPLEVLARLVSSASVFAQTTSESDKELAQQIAIFSTQVSNNPGIVDGAVHILSELGNFPGLPQISGGASEQVSFQTYARSGLLAELNSVDVAGHKRALTDFQFGVWNALRADSSLAISAPTSAGKSFVVLEHLRQAAISKPNFLAIYLAPTRALIAEVQRNLEVQLSGLSKTLRVTTLPIPDGEGRPKQIYVLTQERLQMLLASVNFEHGIDLVIVDEAQAIADGHRGMILQDALEKVLERSANARFLFLAPGASGFPEMGAGVGVPKLEVQETMLSPVVQNRIVVSYDHNVERRLHLSILTSEGETRPVGTFIGGRGFAMDERRRLAAVALELGGAGRSLVYATGPARAEALANQIYTELLPSQDEERQARRMKLAKFIEKDIHRSYSLAKHVRHGVAFHYANMPSLLREGIEGAFRDGHIDFLCCTTTLFQGVNLPARNVFIDTPERGQHGALLDEASLWNFAGRAGRLGKDVVGNVFLVNYDQWETKPLTKRRPFELKVAFQEAITNDYYDVLHALESARERKKPEADPSERAKAAAGLALYRTADGSFDSLLQRPGAKLDSAQLEKLKATAQATLQSMGIPRDVLAANWVIEPFALVTMMERLREGVRKKELKKLIPIHPTDKAAYNTYKGIIFRMYKHFDGKSFKRGESNGFEGFANHVTVIALRWMEGQPLARLVSEAVTYATRKQKEKEEAGKRTRNPEAVVDGAIRNLFELVEKTVRFTLVQWARAYVDLLRVALVEAGYEKEARNIYDFALALELGVSTKTGHSLMELGLSRITAASVAALMNNSAMDANEVKAWIQERQEVIEPQLSELVVDELREKELLPLTQ